MGQLTKQFGKIKVSIPIPHLLNLQVDSYSAFLQEGRKESERDPHVGLEGVFRSVFPIEDFNRTASLEYLGYDISEPKYDQAECISKGLTYEAPVRIKVRLDIYDVDEAANTRTYRDGKEQDIYFGTLPLMTEKGTFIVNGTEIEIYKEKDAAKAQAGVGEVMPQKICHKVDHIGSLRVPKQIAEAEDRIDPEKSSDKSHYIVKGCLVLFLIFHLYSPAYPNF